MRQSLSCIDVETTSVTRGVGIDDNEAVCIGEGGILGSAEVGLRSASAVVDRDDELSGTCDPVGRRRPF